MRVFLTLLLLLTACGSSTGITTASPTAASHQEATVEALVGQPENPLFLNKPIIVREAMVSTPAKTIDQLKAGSWIVRLVDKAGRHINVLLTPAVVQDAGDNSAYTQAVTFLRCAGSYATVTGVWEKTINPGDSAYILIGSKIICSG